MTDASTLDTKVHYLVIESIDPGDEGTQTHRYHYEAVAFESFPTGNDRYIILTLKSNEPTRRLLNSLNQSISDILREGYNTDFRHWHTADHILTIPDSDYHSERDPRKSDPLVYLQRTLQNNLGFIFDVSERVYTQQAIP
jgi:hypothetical protein